MVLGLKVNIRYGYGHRSPYLIRKFENALCFWMNRAVQKVLIFKTLEFSKANDVQSLGTQGASS